MIIRSVPPPICLKGSVAFLMLNEDAWKHLYFRLVGGICG